jgi:uncharacterized protein YuzE
MKTSPIVYDPSTDSMYLTLREGRAAHSVARDDRESAVDIGEDVHPMGYDSQFASQSS